MWVGRHELRKGLSALGPPQEYHEGVPCACWSSLAAERQTMIDSFSARQGECQPGPLTPPEAYVPPL